MVQQALEGKRRMRYVASAFLQLAFDGQFFLFLSENEKEKMKTLYEKRVLW